MFWKINTSISNYQEEILGPIPNITEVNNYFSHTSDAILDIMEPTLNKSP
jgi:hypothetical protein